MIVTVVDGRRSRKAPATSTPESLGIDKVQQNHIWPQPSGLHQSLFAVRGFPAHDPLFNINAQKFPNACAHLARIVGYQDAERHIDVALSGQTPKSKYRRSSTAKTRSWSEAMCLRG
jgi:hypothetical protein